MNHPIAMIHFLSSDSWYMMSHVACWFLSEFPFHLSSNWPPETIFYVKFQRKKKKMSFFDIKRFIFVEVKSNLVLIYLLRTANFHWSIFLLMDFLMFNIVFGKWNCVCFVKKFWVMTVPIGFVRNRFRMYNFDRRFFFSISF